MVKDDFKDAFLIAYKCPVCAKEGYRTSEWAYKRPVGKSHKYFCSYKCATQWDKEHPVPFRNAIKYWRY